MKSPIKREAQLLAMILFLFSIVVLSIIGVGKAKGRTVCGGKNSSRFSKSTK